MVVPGSGEWTSRVTIAMKKDSLATSFASTLYWYCKHSERNSVGSWRLQKVSESKPLKPDNIVLGSLQGTPKWTVYKTVKMKLKLPQTVKFL